MNEIYRAFRGGAENRNGGSLILEGLFFYRKFEGFQR